MNLIWHIIKKDMFRLRWFILLWLIVIALYGVFASMTVDMDSARWSERLASVGLLEYVIYAFIFMMPPLVIQLEPLVGSHYDWLTRPIPRVSLFYAKMILMLAMLTPLALAIACATFVHESFVDVLVGWRYFLPHLSLAFPLALILVMASVTRSFKQYFISAICFMVILAIISSTVYKPMLESSLRGDFIPTKPIDDMVLDFLLFSLSALLVSLVFYQFMKRRHFYVVICSGLLLSTAPVVSVLASSLTDIPADKVPESIISQEQAKLSIVSPKIARGYGGNEIDSMRYIQADIRLEQTPANLSLGSAQGVNYFSSSVVGTTKVKANILFKTDKFEPDKRVAIAGVLSDIDFLNSSSTSVTETTGHGSFKFFQNRDIDTYLNKVSTLKTALYVWVERPKIIAKIPLKEGSLWKDGIESLRISGIHAGAKNLSVKLQTRNIFRHGGIDNMDIAVVNESRKEGLLLGKFVGYRPSRLSPFLMFLDSLWISEHRAKKQDDENWQLTPDWLKDAKVYIITYEELGYIERSASYENFLLTEANDDSETEEEFVM